MNSELQSLTPKECQILQELVNSDGRLDAVVDFMGISINTVKTHLNNAYKKLDAHSMLEAVLIALRLKLIEL